MKYHILDTHTLVWFIENNPTLSQKAKDAILDSNSKKVISVIVLAELKFLANKNRFQPKFEHILEFIENDPHMPDLPRGSKYCGKNPGKS
ncbi:MAG: type II toxin-antitoxin system VapC family toxin [Nitrospinales bacterium]